MKPEDLDVTRIWDADYAEPIHIEPRADDVRLILPDGSHFDLEPDRVKAFRLALARWERARAAA